MITLPTHARRHWVTAFAKALTALLIASCAVLGAGLWWIMSSGSPLAGAGVGAALGIVMSALLFATDASRRRSYDVWVRMSRRISSALAAYLTRLLFGVIAVAGIGGSRFELRRPRGASTNWRPKQPVPGEAYVSQHGSPDAPDMGWIRAYVSWGLKDGGVWVLFVLPLIALLGWVQTQEKGSFGGNVYTLY